MHTMRRLFFLPVHTLVGMAFIVAAAGSTMSYILEESWQFEPVAVSEAWAPQRPGGSVLGVRTPSAVTWTHLVNVIAEGGDLEQVAGYCVGCADAGAHSVQQISGDGYFEFSIAPGAYHYVYAGLNTDTSASTSIVMPFALEISGSYVNVRERGIYKSDTPFAAGDVFRVAVESGKVKYYKNNNLFYTSAAVPVFPLVADVSMQSVGSLLWGGKIAVEDTVVTPSAPVIASFTASPMSLTAGQTTRLAWSVTGATVLSVDQGVGVVTGATGETVAPTSTTAYTLTATGEGGITTSTVTVRVVPVEPPPSASVCSTVVPQGQFTGCYYNNRDLTSFKFSRTNAYPINFNWGKGSPGRTISSDTFSVSWVGQFNFENDSYVFTTTVDDGVRVYVDGSLIIDKWSGTPGTHTATVSPGAGTHVVRMDYYENRGSAKAALSWNKFTTPPAPTPIISSFTASPASIASGSSTLAWTVSGATSVSINQGVGTVTGTTTKVVTPTATTTYTLTATNSSGSVTASATVTVNAVTPTTIVDGYGDALSLGQFNGWFFSQVGDTAAIITYENVNDTTKTYTQTASRTISRPDAETWLKSTYGTNFTITQPLGFTVNPSTVVTAPGTYRIKSVKLNTSSINILLGSSAQGTFVVGGTPPVTAVAYGVDFATYFGGNGYDSIRDITTDGSGNIYVVGGTQSTDFPLTMGQGLAGSMDVFVTKLSPTGQIIWSQLLGGPNYDRAYGVELDAQGNVYLSGRSGRGFPLRNAFQTTFSGYNTGAAYGEQNLFLAKLSSAGSVLWSTYVGTADMARDLAVDPSGNIYLASNYSPALGQSQFPSTWFASAFQKTPQGGVDEVIIKVDTNGTGVQWATYLGGSGDENPKISVRVDGGGNLMILSDTSSTNAPVLNAYQSVNRLGPNDAYLVKMKPDGTGILWATFFGGSGSEYNETHHLGVDASGNTYLAIMSQSTDAPTTVGAYDRTYNGEGGGALHAYGDTLVAKFNSSGQLIASTYVGGNGGDGPQGVGVDAQGNVYFSGGTTSTNFPVTAGAAVTTKQGGVDVFGARLSSDLSKLDYATYIGTSANEEGRVIWADGAGAFYVGCEVASGGMQPLVNALQSSFGGGAQDACVAKFSLR